MDIAALIADAKTAVSLAQLAIQVGEDAAPFVENAYNILVKGTSLTDQQRSEMLASETTLRATLQAPLPDA